MVQGGAAFASTGDWKGSSHLGGPMNAGPASSDQGSSAVWTPGPSLPVLAPRALHIWRVALDVPTGEIRGLAALLDATEQARANRFRFERDCCRWVVARATLRALLGRYLGESPAAVSFMQGSAGKPALGGRHSNSALRFNLSHSGAIALIAVTQGEEVGVDVEQIVPMPDAGLLAETCFAAEERESLRHLSADHAQAAFFDCWTRKEAYIKALGGGLSIPLDSFQVAVGEREACRFVHLDGDAAAAAAWSLVPLDPRPGYVGAAAVRFAGATTHCWHWA